jgi:hypothetical protein
VIEQLDGPPGPDTEVVDVDEREVFLVEDNYKRRNDGAKLASLLNDVCGDTVVDASKYTDAWWANREQDLADERAKHAAREERERMRDRAELLIHTEGQAGSRCRFPRWAVEGALRTSLDTPALKHSRKFIDASIRERFAADQRRLGERDDDPAPEAPRILVLAGGTGGGKTTAAAWIGLKSTDRMPGFIRASELERRGRYDKELKVWIPERTSLVIDDIGAELLDGKSVFRSFLDEIVDDFYSSKRRLIFTTNLKPKIDDAYKAECARDNRDPEPQFRERYGERVRSRVVQVGQWSDCGNADLREGSR